MRNMTTGFCDAYASWQKGGVIVRLTHNCLTVQPKSTPPEVLATTHVAWDISLSVTDRAVQRSLDAFMRG